MRNVAIKNITDKADELARQYNKTKDPRIKELWYQKIREILKYPLKEQEGNRINFKGRIDNTRKIY